jgi:hypothetical protein
MGRAQILRVIVNEDNLAGGAARTLNDMAHDQL